MKQNRNAIGCDKETLKKVLDALKRLELELRAAIDQLEKALGVTEMPTPPDWMIRPLKVAWEIKKRGGTVPKEDLLSIVKQAGYDTRGLGGLFVGKRAWLVRIAEGRVALTEEAEKLLNRYKDWLENLEKIRK